MKKDTIYSFVFHAYMSAYTHQLYYGNTLLRVIQ